MPKHVFEGKDFNKINFEFPVVSGALYPRDHKRRYLSDPGAPVRLVAKSCPTFPGIGNFQTMKFRFYAERENAFEAFKKGQFDLFPIYTSRLWVNETRGEKFSNDWIVKTENLQPESHRLPGLCHEYAHPPLR